MDEFILWQKLRQQFNATCTTFDSSWIRRRRLFDTKSLVKGLLHLVGGGRLSYQLVMDQLDLPGTSAPAAASFCEARAKLPPFVIGEIRRDLLDLFDEEYSAQTAPKPQWHGYRLHAVDGTRVAMPRPFFAHGFKSPPGGHCPEALVSMLVRIDDKMACDVRLSKQKNERDEAHEHLAHLAPGDLVVYDRGYLSFGLLAAHCSTDIAALFRVARGTSFLPVEKFWRSPKRDVIVTIDPTAVTYRHTAKQYPMYNLGPIKLRLLKYEIANETYVLATTILDQGISLEEYVDLYQQRWSAAEETFKALKQTLALETFHSHSESGIEQEVEATALLWNISRMTALMSVGHFKKTKSLLKVIAAASSQLSPMSVKSR